MDNKFKVGDPIVIKDNSCMHDKDATVIEAPSINHPEYLLVKLTDLNLSPSTWYVIPQFLDSKKIDRHSVLYVEDCEYSIKVLGSKQEAYEFATSFMIKNQNCLDNTIEFIFKGKPLEQSKDYDKNE